MLTGKDNKGVNIKFWTVELSDPMIQSNLKACQAVVNVRSDWIVIVGLIKPN